jgi:hypothetical protein
MKTGPGNSRHSPPKKHRVFHKPESEKTSRHRRFMEFVTKRERATIKIFEEGLKRIR